MYNIFLKQEPNLDDPKTLILHDYMLLHKLSSGLFDEISNH